MIYMGITGTPISVWLFAFPVNIKKAPSEKNSEFLIKKYVGCLFVKPSAVSVCCFPVWRIELLYGSHFILGWF
jgi:hypothetical protein